MLFHKTVALLAGGRSSRMGTLKGLLTYRGRPWILEQIERLRSHSIEHIIIVLGYRHDEYLNALPILKDPPPFLTVAVNSHPEGGLFASLQCAIHHRISKNTSPDQALFVLPIDVPCPTFEVWDRLGQALLPPLDVVIPQKNDKRGHPVLLSDSFQKRLLDVPHQSPLARLDIQIHLLSPLQRSVVPVDDLQILMNINTPEAWKEWLKYS